MSKKARILVSALAAVVLLTVAGVATVAAKEKALLPQSGAVQLASTGDNQTAGLMARAAAILGIPEDELVSAFQQARQEIREAAFSKMLDKAVEQGRLTPDEAKAIREWWQQRPDVLNKGLAPRFFGKSGFGGHLRDLRGGQRMMGRGKGLNLNKTFQSSQLN